MAEYSHTYYKLTVGPGLGSGEAYQGDIERAPMLFSKGSGWLEAIADLATKANVVILTDQGHYHPIDSNYSPTTEDLARAEPGKILYGAYKNSLTLLHEVKIIRLK